MKKALIIICGLIAFLLIGSYYLFPGALFNLAVQAGRLSAGLDKKEIQVDDHRIIYLEGGKGETIILLHGFGANKDNWTTFAKYLTGSYHLLIPDLPGFGESSQIQKATYDAESQIQRINRFAEILHIEKFHMAGNSMGGTLTALYGAIYPQKILTLALLAPGGVGSPNPSELTILLGKGINPLVTDSLADFDRLINLCFANPPFIPRQFKKVLADDAIAHRDFNKKVWSEMVNDATKGDATKENYLKPYLGKVQAPVLVIWGAADKVLDVGGAAILEANLNNCQTMIMQDTGHSPMLEKPQETALHYLSYLRGKK